MKRTLALLLMLSVGGISFPTHAALISMLVPEGSVAYKGKVVDQTTGKPLSGVLVVASWGDFSINLSDTQIEGGPIYSCRQLVNVETAVSGPDGSFEIPAWSWKHGACDFMLVNQPRMIWYKPGYALIQRTQVPVDQELVPGPYYTVSGSDVGTIPMNPLGPHYYQFEDSHIKNLMAYAGALRISLGEDEKGPCFWKEESPALLLLFQEERRLSKYATDDLDLFNDKIVGPITGRRCTDPAAVAALKQQAQATPVEQPVLPYVRRLSFKTAMDAPAPDEASAPPKELADYLEAEMAPDHAADAKYVIYHVDVNPANPYYLAVLNIGFGYGDFGVPGVPEQPDPKTLARSGIFGLTCPAFDDIPPAAPDGPPEYEHASGSTGNVAIHQGALLVNPPPTAVDRACRWTVALSVTDTFQAMTLTAVGDHWDVYDAKSGIWTLTERALLRAKQESLPEIVEISGPEPLSVSTTLAPAGPNRWYLPAGQPFTMTIKVSRQ